MKYNELYSGLIATLSSSAYCRDHHRFIRSLSANIISAAIQRYANKSGDRLIIRDIMVVVHGWTKGADSQQSGVDTHRFA